MKKYKTYRELTTEERVKTFNRYQDLCNINRCFEPYESFEDYNEEQVMYDFDFDCETLECLG